MVLHSAARPFSLQKRNLQMVNKGVKKMTSKFHFITLKNMDFRT